MDFKTITHGIDSLNIPALKDIKYLIYNKEGLKKDMEVSYERGEDKYEGIIKSNVEGNKVSVRVLKLNGKSYEKDIKVLVSSFSSHKNKYDEVKFKYKGKEYKGIIIDENENKYTIMFKEKKITFSSIKISSV